MNLASSASPEDRGAHRALAERFIDSVLTRCSEGLRRREVRDAAARAALDFVLCAAGGARSRTLPRLDGAGASTVVGASSGAPSGVAAATNAASAHAHDRDDLHWPSLTHPGAIVWATALAAGEDADRTWEQTVHGAVAGYEVTARLGSALGAAHRRFWHVTATAGTVGAAVTAGVTVGSDASRIVDAVGHAASVAGGGTQALLEHSDTAIFHRAHAAATGLAAARAAESGLRGAQQALDGERGMFAATAGGSDVGRLFDDRDRLAVEELTVRILPCTGFAHTAVQIACDLADVGRPIDRLTIEVPELAAALAGDPHPRDATQAWWSIPHAVAVCLLGGGAEALLEPWRADDAITALLDRTDLLARPTQQHDDLGCRVRVRWGDGEESQMKRSVPHGHPQDPLSDEELAGKARWLGSDVEQDDALALLETLRSAWDRPVRDVARRIDAVLGPLSPCTTTEVAG